MPIIANALPSWLDKSMVMFGYFTFVFISIFAFLFLVWIFIYYYLYYGMGVARCVLFSKHFSSRRVCRTYLQPVDNLPFPVDNFGETNQHFCLMFVQGLYAPPFRLGTLTDTPTAHTLVSPAHHFRRTGLYASDMPAPSRPRKESHNLQIAEVIHAIGEVSIAVDGTLVAASVAVGGTHTANVGPGKHRVQVGAADGSVLLDQVIDAPEGQLTSAWIRGGAGEDFTTSIRRIAGLDTAPTGIPSGNSGLVGDRPSNGLVASLITMMGLSGLGMALHRRWLRTSPLARAGRGAHRR